jgi:hypothetical protein
MASICAETMKRQCAKRDLDDKVLTGVGHHTHAAALLHHIEVHYKQVSGSSCPPLSHSRPSACVALRFRWIDWCRRCDVDYSKIKSFWLVKSSVDK